MLRVIVEIVPGGFGRARRLGTMYIANDGTGDVMSGNYTVKATTDRDDDRYGEVKDYPRLRTNVWRLVARALLSAFPEEGS